MTGSLRDALEQERLMFEMWVKAAHKDLWPNAHGDGTHYDSNGVYYNAVLQHMWSAWQARALRES